MEKEELHCHYSNLPSPAAYQKDDIDYDTLKRFCAGFRTHIFGDARDEYFDTNDALVWIDADSIVRNDLKELEDFCENNDFDVSARPKNTKYKYASGLIIQKPTIFKHKNKNNEIPTIIIQKPMIFKQKTTKENPNKKKKTRFWKNPRSGKGKPFPRYGF